MDKLETVFNKFSPLAFSISLSILKSREDAEDVVQELFLYKVPAILKSKPGISMRDMGRLLVVVARNLAIDVYRRHKKCVSLQPESSAALAPGETDDSLDIRLLMEKLEPNFREVLTLKYLFGMTWEQAARETGLSVQGTRKRAGKALSLFRVLFGGSETNDQTK